MANTQDVNQKIHSLGNMQKVMRAMNMIATIKLRKLFALQESLKLFDLSVKNMIRQAAPALRLDQSLLMVGHPKVLKAHIILFTADKGLCGSHNNSVYKALELLTEANRAKGIQIEVTCIGTKGGGYARKKGFTIFHQTEINDRVFGSNELQTLADAIYTRFLEGKVQVVYLINNVFVSTIHQETHSLRLLPLPFPDAAPNEKALLPPLIEPAAEEFMKEGGSLLFRYLLRSANAHSSLSEQASRMTAMENASNNAKDLTNRYIKVRNRARQSSITNELIEIISGKEALKR